MPGTMATLSIALINPNANARTTAMMVGIARDAAAGMGPGRHLSITGHTAATGPDMIIDGEALARSAAAVGEIVHSLAAPSAAAAPDALIVAAYGDPGLGIAETCFPGRVFGIGTASMHAAAAEGRRFAIATTTPGLVAVIDARAEALGLGGAYAGVFLTRTGPLELAADLDRQRDELASAVATAVRVGGADAVIIGGGPLARSARELAPHLEVPLIEPIPAALRAAATVLG